MSRTRIWRSSRRVMRPRPSWKTAESSPRNNHLASVGTRLDQNEPQRFRASPQVAQGSTAYSGPRNSPRRDRRRPCRAEVCCRTEWRSFVLLAVIAFGTIPPRAPTAADRTRRAPCPSGQEFRPRDAAAMRRDCRCAGSSTTAPSRRKSCCAARDRGHEVKCFAVGHAA